MKKSLLTLFIAAIFLHTFSQQMYVKQPHFSTFPKDEKRITLVLEKNSSTEAKQHPEYGVLPYNTQCRECVELIDKRTETTRQFMDAKSATHFYSQSSYFPLHYKKSENDIWRTIDKRLHPTTQPNVFVADNQPVPTKCDMNKRSTSLMIDGFEFEFNKQLSMYFFDESQLYTNNQPGDFTSYTVGMEGLQVKNIWPGVDMQQIFSNGEIETKYVINAPLQLPVSKGWMVFEDHFSLPAGYTVDESKTGDHIENGYYRGDYLIRNTGGDTIALWRKSVYVDAKAFGMPGVYKLLKAGNEYTLQTLVPVEWLTKTDNLYPLFIDPTVAGVTKFGNFISSGFTKANMGFTSMALGSCDYHMLVIVPGGSVLSKAYLDAEYSLTYDNTCGNPPLAAPFCTFSQVSMEVLNDSCGTTTGLFTCNPPAPPYTGTCTTDSNLVAGAHAYVITDFIPNYLSCIHIPANCADYNIPFTIKNRDSVCLDMCGYLCARGNMWQMTVEGNGVQIDTATHTADNLCPGQAVVFTGHAYGGFPPYSYFWSQDTTNYSYDSIFNNPHYTLYPTQNTLVFYWVEDSCHKVIAADTNLYEIFVAPAPRITISGDTLTSSIASGLQWYLNNSLIGATSQSIIVSTPGLYSVKAGVDTCPSAQVAWPAVSGINNITASGTNLQIIPNPSSGNFTIRITASENVAEAALKLFENTGRLVLSKNIGIAPGMNNYTFNNEQLAKGIYLLQVATPAKVFTQKVVIE